MILAPFLHYIKLSNKVINPPGQYLSMERERASTTVEIDKELLLKFKSICVLNELTMSEVIEEMIRDWVSKNEGRKHSHRPEPAEESSQEAGPGDDEELSDEIEEQVEKG